MKDIGFDIISDLYLSPDDSFNWEGKATSLYCIIAGNISNDTRTFILTLSHLSKFYQGVFFTTGQYDVSGKTDIEDYNSKISHAFEKKHNITSLYQNVVIIHYWRLAASMCCSCAFRPSRSSMSLQVKD